MRVAGLVRQREAGVKGEVEGSTMDYVPVEDLRRALLTTFAGETVTRDQIYDRHSVGTPFIRPDYNEALRILEGTGQIEIASDSPRRKGTFREHVRITFPDRP